MGKFSNIKSNIVTDNSSRLPRSERTFQHIRSLAQRYTRTKFTSIVGDKCIPNIPESRIPMIIVYRKGDIRHQIVAWGADEDRQPEGRTPFTNLTTISDIIESFSELEAILLVTGALDLPEKFSGYGGHRVEKDGNDDGDNDDDDDDDDDPSSRMRSAVTSTNARHPKNIRSSQKNKNDSDSEFEFDM